MAPSEADTPLAIYRRAAAMESKLRHLMDEEPHALLEGANITAFNQLLEAARHLVPNSVALRQDLELIDDTHVLAVDNAWHAVHVTLLPTLHNALPESDYEHV